MQSVSTAGGEYLAKKSATGKTLVGLSGHLPRKVQYELKCMGSVDWAEERRVCSIRRNLWSQDLKLTRLEG